MAILSEMKAPTMKRTTIYIPKPLYADFHKACIDAERPMSDVIRELINRWLKEGGASKKNRRAD